MARKARLEGGVAPTGGEVEVNGRVLVAIVDRFKAKHPDRWEELRLCPLQHGLDEMVACLNS
jgi:hypothetical protein